MNSCSIAIVGAGPYGLSAAAHLRAANIEGVRLFGECMSFWDRHMPIGMFLRSPWQATHLSDPGRQWTLDAYQSVNGNHFLKPLPLGRFIDYGRWFQTHAAPDLDSRKVASIEPNSLGYCLKLGDGEVMTAQRVIIASGIVPFAWRPPEFRDLPRDL